MSTNKMRFLNMMQNVKIKQEILDDDDVVQCRLCSKGFANTMALNNHARVEHIAEYVAGEDLCIEPVRTKQPKQTKTQQREVARHVKLKTEELISSMSPTNLTTFASPDVSYIIIKTDDEPEPKRKKERPVKKKEKQEAERIVVRKEKEALPISGPFECLQPSTLVSDGTCHQIFFSCCEYSAHYRDEHTRRRKGVRCQVCEKLLGLEVGGAAWACETCGKGFNTEQELTDHTASAHVKRKPFQCNICYKRFTQQGGVQQHMRMHTGDRPFACTICPKTFSQKSGLEQHLRIHTKDRPYRCVICSKSFCQSIHLKQHMRTHTNVSPFQCAICQKRFKQSSHLNYHLKYHNPANMTEEQKLKYKKLVGMMKPDTMQVEVNPSHLQLYEIVQEGEGINGQTQYMGVDENGQTQYIAVEDSGEAEYIGAEHSGETEYTGVEESGETEYNGETEYTGMEENQEAEYSGETEYSGVEESGETEYSANSEYTGVEQSGEAEYSEETEYTGVEDSGETEYTGETEYVLGHCVVEEV